MNFQESNHQRPKVGSEKQADINREELTRLFNTALVGSHQERSRSFSTEMATLMASPAFHCILEAVHLLAIKQNIDKKAAAEQMVTTFQSLDSLWKSYLVQEGLNRLKIKS